MSPAGSTAELKVPTSVAPYLSLKNGWRQAITFFCLVQVSGWTMAVPIPLAAPSVKLPRNLVDEPTVPGSPGEPDRSKQGGLDDRPVHAALRRVRSRSRLVGRTPGACVRHSLRSSPHCEGPRRFSTGGCRPSPASTRRHGPAGRSRSGRRSPPPASGSRNCAESGRGTTSSHDLGRVPRSARGGGGRPPRAPPSPADRRRRAAVEPLDLRRHEPEPLNSLAAVGEAEPAEAAVQRSTGARVGRRCCGTAARSG